MYVDFQEVKQRASLEAAAEMLRLSMKVTGNQLRGPCPHCKSGGDRALAITPGKGFYCWASHKSGDQIALVAHVLNVSPKDAARQLAEHVGMVTVPQGTSSRNIVPPSAQGKETEKLQPLAYLDASHDAVNAVGFAPEDAERLGIGFANKGIMRGLVAVPIRTDSGHLCGYIGISEARLPKAWHFEADPPNVVRLRPKTA